MKTRSEIDAQTLAGLLWEIAGDDSELAAAIVYDHCGIPEVAGPFVGRARYSPSYALEEQVQSMLRGRLSDERDLLVDAITPIAAPFRRPFDPIPIMWRQPDLHHVAELLRTLREEASASSALPRSR